MLTRVRGLGVLLNLPAIAYRQPVHDHGDDPHRPIGRCDVALSIEDSEQQHDYQPGYHSGDSDHPGFMTEHRACCHDGGCHECLACAAPSLRRSTCLVVLLTVAVGGRPVRESSHVPARRASAWCLVGQSHAMWQRSGVIARAPGWPPAGTSGGPDGPVTRRSGAASPLRRRADPPPVLCRPAASSSLSSGSVDTASLVLTCADDIRGR
jgi:hypothetical protein